MSPLVRFVGLLGASAICVSSATPAFAQTDPVQHDPSLTLTCSTLYLLYGGRSDAYGKMLDLAAARTGRSRGDVARQVEADTETLRQKLWQRLLAPADALVAATEQCPQMFGIPAPAIVYDPAPPIAPADLPTYQFAAGKVWNCQADVPETLERDAEAHTYRLRFGFGLNDQLRLIGDLDVYEANQSGPFVRYRLGGWPYRSRMAPAVVAELEQQTSNQSLPEYMDWRGFRMNIDIRPATDGRGYYLAAQIDRRSDSATYVNLTQCYYE